LAQQTILGYRSDFVQFVESLRDHGRLGLARRGSNNSCRLKVREI